MDGVKRVGSRRADLAEQLFLEKWYGIDQNDAQQIIEAAQRLSDEELLNLPVLVTAAMVASQLLKNLDSQDHAAGLERFANLMIQSPESAIGASLTGQRLRHWRLMEMIARRWRREYDSALELSDLLESRSTTASLRDSLFSSGDDGLWPGHVTLQRGVTEALGGKLGAAMRSFNRAYIEGGEPPYGHFAKANAVANAAMVSALEGNTQAAEQWAERSRTLAPVPAAIHHLTFVGRDIAEAQIAMDRNQLELARKILARTAEAGETIELWPFLLHVTVALDLATDRVVPAFERLKAAGFERNRITAIDPVADYLVFRSYLDVLVAAGEGGLVLRLADDLGHPLRSLIPVARTHLFAGDYLRASRVASHALRRAELSLRDMWEATWVHALAETGAGNLEAASRSYSLIRKGRPVAFAALISRSPRELVEQLYDTHGEAPPESMNHAGPIGITMPSLTPREREILQLIAEGLSPREIAEQEVTSEHTVRTHVKHIYRKLGATTRRDAVVKAEQLGLLRWFHLDGDNHALST